MAVVSKEAKVKRGEKNNNGRKEDCVKSKKDAKKKGVMAKASKELYEVKLGMFLRRKGRI